MARKRRSRRPLRFQGLEKRHLLAAYISELLVDATFGNNDTDQMVELRGEPNSTLADGTYLVVVNERFTNEGKIHGIFDLSGQQFGSNGYLALLQKDSPHQAHPNSNVLQSTTEAFGGLPGGIYTDSHSLSDRIDFIIGSNAYLLIQSNVAPQLNDDIDVDNDSSIDAAVLANWTIHDSISLHSFVGRGVVSYGSIVFAEIGSSASTLETPAEVELIHTEGFGYGGRVGASIGSRSSDWVAGTVQDETRTDDTEPPRWALVDNLFGVPSQYPYSGRDLDHVGDDNFVGGVRGTLTSGTPAAPVEGVTVLADTNGNGIRDDLTFVVDPDDVVDPLNELEGTGKYPLINAYPGVTITKFSLDEFPSSAVTAEKESDFPNTLDNRIFATGGIDWFQNSGVLRFDFYRPINSLSIVAIGSDNPLSEVYGRIDAFNAEGELLQTVHSGLLLDSERQTIAVTSDTDDIAYVYVYSDQEFLNGGPFGRFDRMIFTQPEATATSDANGNYDIRHLFPDEYDIVLLGSSVGNPPRPFTVTKYENFVENFEVTPNQPPQITGSTTFSVAENREAGATVGTVAALDPDGQTVTFELEQDEPRQFNINESTGVITVAPQAELDFESVDQYVLQVVVRDPKGAATDAQVTINVTDQNETPTAEPAEFEVAENSNVGTVLGMITAADPDTKANQSLRYTIVGGNGSALIGVDQQTGVVSVISPQLNFESTRQWQLNVRISDNGVPSKSTDTTVTVNVTDVNEPPAIQAAVLEVNEKPTAGQFVGTIPANDPDDNQSLQFEIVGGNAAPHFDLNPITGRVTVAENALLDFETAPELTLTVRVHDSGSPAMSDTRDVTVMILDDNEPPVVTAAEWSIAESADAGQEVGIVAADDPDVNQQLSFAIIGGNVGSLFQMDSSTGRVSVNDAVTLNHEEQPELALQVRVTDNGSPARSATETFIVRVTDVNEPPQIVTETLQVDENTSGALGEIEVIDEDMGQIHSFAIVGGTGQQQLTISEQGVVSVAANQTLDFEAGGSLAIDVRVTDSGDPALSTTETITVFLADVDEPPQFMDDIDAPMATSGANFEFQLPENLVVDPEGDEVTIHALLDGNALPPWLEFDPTTWMFQGLPSSFYIGSVTLTIEVTQVGAPSLMATTTFELTVQVGENPLHNTVNPYDVDNKNGTTAADALRVINYMSRAGGPSDVVPSIRLDVFLDVSKDNVISALDALRIINELARIAVNVPDAESPTLATSLHQRQDDALRLYLEDAGLF